MGDGQPETLFKDRKLVAGKGGNGIPFGGQGLVSQCIDLIWVQVMSAFIVNGHGYQPLFLNGDRNRSTCITCIPCIPFAGNEQGLKDLVSVMQIFEGSLTARLLITMGSGSSAQYQLTAEEAVQ